MGFLVDLGIILLYFAGISAIGLYMGRREESLKDFALAGRQVPWWAVMASIIAAETSAATFLGAPGEGFAKRSLAYVQLTLGVVLGRWVVANVFLKPYYDYKVYTVYDYLAVRFGRVAIKRPDGPARDLPASVALTFIEVIESDPPPGAEPVHWRLLTTHDVPDAQTAWRIVGWYKQRWTIEQLFRVLKSQGLQLEDSQLETAERLLKLAAIATQAAAVILQLVQARDGRTPEPADIVFSAPEIKTLDALVPTLEGKTALQKNPYPSHSLAWAAWVIAKLGGWDGYPRSTPPGPITFKLGIDRFKAIALGHALHNV